MKSKNQFITTKDSIKIWVETFGDHKDEACLLISGAGANSSFWRDNLCNKLVENGFFVIKYDHRDIGYSSKTDFDKHPYDVMQLAKDAVTILDSLEVKQTHVIGHSMGGFIAQLMAIHFADRILSLISASASTNSPLVPAPPEKTWQIFMEFSPGNNYQKDLNGFLRVWEYLNGTARFDKELAIDYTKNLYKRQEIKGALGESHVKAQANISDRTKLLNKLDIPTLVIHGEEDYLVDKYGGIQMASCMENSRLILIPKMGHLPFNHEIRNKFEKVITDFLIQNKT